MRNEFNHKKLQGTDASIEISLKEYGVAWVEKGNEILVYFGTDVLDDSSFYKFGYVIESKNLDITEDYDWVDFDRLTTYIDCDILELPLPLQLYHLLSYCGYENIFPGEAGHLIYPEVISGDKVRLKDIEDLGCRFSAEEIAEFAESYDGIMNIKVINKFYRVQDESHLWPVNNEYDVTERAIRRVRKFDCPVYGLEYCCAIENAISLIVNRGN